MDLFQVIDATWPAKTQTQCGPFTLRDGAGRGQRVSAATCTGDASDAEITAAEDAMRAQSQPPLFMIRGAQPGLDAQLEARGYQRKDPTLVMSAPTEQVMGDGPERVSAFTVWPPIAIQHELWPLGGIGPERMAVMARVTGPKTSLIGRTEETPSGCAFVAIAGDTAMLHALDVTPKLRRRNSARNLTKGAAQWALARGATRFAVLTTSENLPAQRLFSSLGLCTVEHYHYRAGA